MMTGVSMEIPGNTGTAYIVGNDNKLRIFVAGLSTPDSLGNTIGGTMFAWDVTNSQEQFVEPGNYYIKVEEQDEYGHINVVVKDVEVVRTESYIELKVYNGAGELVRTIRETDKPLPLTADLSGMGDLIIVEKNGTPINVKYGTGATDYIQWDGKNDNGTVVSSGNYELQLTVETPAGNVTRAAKTVILLREDKTYIKDFKASPSPYSKDSGVDHITFAWTCLTAGETGGVYIRVYNVAGEIVKEIKTTLQAGAATWDLKEGMEGHVSRGFYIAVINATNAQGYMDTKTTKLAVISYN